MTRYARAGVALAVGTVLLLVATILMTAFVDTPGHPELIALIPGIFLLAASFACQFDPSHTLPRILRRLAIWNAGAIVVALITMVAFTSAQFLESFLVSVLSVQGSLLLRASALYCER